MISDGETGFLIPAADAVGYADCIERLLRHPELYQRVAERAYERTTREYNEQSYCARIGELYQECLGARGASSSVVRCQPLARSVSEETP